MRGLAIPAAQNLGGVVILLVFLAVISQATGGEATDCDKDNTCWYVKPGKITIRVRSWRCAWIWKCWTYEVSSGIPEQVCQCCPGWWQGDASNCQRCPAGQFGYNCKRECECTDGELTRCDKRNGECYSSNQTLSQTFLDNCGGLNCTKGQICNHSNGTCHCPPMWRGEKCDSYSGCPGGFYGYSCDQKCRCNNGTSHCDVLTGQCMCYRGWLGPTCNETCPPGHYGENCSMVCDCPKNATECDPVSGDCLCPAGYYGRSCSNECPDGRFGPSCQSPCTCDNSTETCNRLNGTCTGKYDQGVSNDDDDDPLPSSLAGPVVGTIFGIALVALLAIFILLLIRRANQTNQTRDTLAVKVFGVTDNPIYEESLGTSDSVPNTGTLSSHTPLQHFVVGGATYAMHDKETRHPSSCNAGFEDSYSHLHPATGDCSNPQHLNEQNDYSHLERDDRTALRTSHPAEYARVVDTTRVVQSKAKANEYDNLNRGVNQPGRVEDKNKYEVVI